MLNLNIIVGSTRPGRAADHVVPWIAGLAFRHKPTAFVGYSGGVAAGVRAIEHLAHIAIEAEMVPLRSTVLIPLVGAAFDHNGDPQNPAAATAAGIMLDDLAWWAVVLQQARRDNPLPPAALRKMAAAGNSAH